MGRFYKPAPVQGNIDYMYKAPQELMMAAVANIDAQNNAVIKTADDAESLLGKLKALPGDEELLNQKRRELTDQGNILTQAVYDKPENWGRYKRAARQYGKTIANSIAEGPIADIISQYTKFTDWDKEQKERIGKDIDAATYNAARARVLENYEGIKVDPLTGQTTGGIQVKPLSKVVDVFKEMDEALKGVMASATKTSGTGLNAQYMINTEQGVKTVPYSRLVEIAQGVVAAKPELRDSLRQMGALGTGDPEEVLANAIDAAAKKYAFSEITDLSKTEVNPAWTTQYTQQQENWRHSDQQRFTAQQAVLNFQRDKLGDYYTALLTNAKNGTGADGSKLSPAAKASIELKTEWIKQRVIGNMSGINPANVDAVLAVFGVAGGGVPDDAPQRLAKMGIEIPGLTTIANDPNGDGTIVVADPKANETMANIKSAMNGIDMQTNPTGVGFGAQPEVQQPIVPIRPGVTFTGSTKNLPEGAHYFNIQTGQIYDSQMNDITGEAPPSQKKSPVTNSGTPSGSRTVTPAATTVSPKGATVTTTTAPTPAPAQGKQQFISPYKIDEAGNLDIIPHGGPTNMYTYGSVTSNLSQAKKDLAKMEADRVVYQQKNDTNMVKRYDESIYRKNVEIQNMETIKNKAVIEGSKNLSEGDRKFFNNYHRNFTQNVAQLNKAKAAYQAEKKERESKEEAIRRTNPTYGFMESTLDKLFGVSHPAEEAYKSLANTFNHYKELEGNFVSGMDAALSTMSGTAKPVTTFKATPNLEQAVYTGLGKDHSAFSIIDPATGESGGNIKIADGNKLTFGGDNDEPTIWKYLADHKKTLESVMKVERFTGPAPGATNPGTTGSAAIVKFNIPGVDPNKPYLLKVPRGVEEMMGNMLLQSDQPDHQAVGRDIINMNRGQFIRRAMEGVNMPVYPGETGVRHVVDYQKTDESGTNQLYKVGITPKNIGGEKIIIAEYQNNSGQWIPIPGLKIDPRTGQPMTDANGNLLKGNRNGVYQNVGDLANELYLSIPK